jgi:6-phosphogluconolactonase
MTVYAVNQASGAPSKLASYPVGRKPNWIEFIGLL